MHRLRQARIAIALSLAKLVLHLSLYSEYGYHRDELYFIACGEHLSWGYVDHPPFVPAVAAAVGTLFDHGLFGMRLFPALASAGAVFLAIAVCRQLGGGQRAQMWTGVALIVAPAFLRMSKMLNIVVFEPLFWTAATWLVLKIFDCDAKRRKRPLWLAVGAVVGLGLLNKHTMLLWCVGLLLGLLLTEERRHLRDKWIYLGAVVAVVVFAPNVTWQALNAWPTLQFIGNMRQSTLAQIPREMFVIGQLLYIGPLAAPIWVVGLVSLWRRHRWLAIHFVVVALLFVVMRAKPYYLAAAYPALLAAGAVAIERWTSKHMWLIAFAVGSFPLAVLCLPVLPLATIDGALEKTLGGVVRPRDLTHDLHDEYGWSDQARIVRGVFGALPPEQQRSAFIVTANYGQASALRFFAPQLPGAISGHMSYHLWDDDHARVGPMIVYGFGHHTTQRICHDPTEKARIEHPIAQETNLPIYLCAPRVDRAELRRIIKRYRHGG